MAFLVARRYNARPGTQLGATRSTAYKFMVFSVLFIFKAGVWAALKHDHYIWASTKACGTTIRAAVHVDVGGPVCGGATGGDATRTSHARQGFRFKVSCTMSRAHHTTRFAAVDHHA